MLQVEQILQERYQIKQQLGQNAGRQIWLAQDFAKQPAEPVCAFISVNVLAIWLNTTE